MSKAEADQDRQGARDARPPAGREPRGDLQDATGWQPHSARAALSGLRKAGHAIERSAGRRQGAAGRSTGSPPRPEAAE